MHKKQLYRESSFLTLTYNEKCLGNTLVKRDLQLVRQSSGTGQKAKFPCHIDSYEYTLLGGGPVQQLLRS